MKRFKMFTRLCRELLPTQALGVTPNATRKVVFGLGILLVLSSVVLVFVPSVAQADVPKLINFQGILKDGSGNPVVGSNNVTFSIYTAPTNGAVLWAETTSVTTNAQGLFTVLLGADNPVPDSVFNDTTRYLGIKVGGDAEMTPRQRLASVGYSFAFAGWTIQDSNIILAERLGGSVGIGTDTPTEKLEVEGNIKGDTIKADAFSSASPLRLQTSGVTRIYVDDATGRVGIGTTSPTRALELATGDLRLSGSTAEIGYSASADLAGRADDPAPPNPIASPPDPCFRLFSGVSHDLLFAINNSGDVSTGGVLKSGNSITIDGINNRITSSGDLDLLLGSTNRALRIENNITSPNFIGGNFFNYVTGGVVGATIAGGGSTLDTNRVTDSYGTVSGGRNNRAGDAAGTVADRPFATVGGGSGNSADGFLSTIPGGYLNSASGNYSFAAGRRAKANHTGAFVWGDSTNSDFTSTAVNQFLIRASGGVGIGTNNPGSHQLQVGPGGAGFGTDLLNVSATSGNNGISVRSGPATPAATDVAAVRLFRGSFETGFISAENGYLFKMFNRIASDGITIDTVGQTGIGTTTPKNKLDVEGGAVIGGTYSGTNTAPAHGLLVQGSVGIGTTSPEEALHVQEGSAGAVTANAGSIAVFEKAGDAYLSILTPDANARGILFGQPASPEAGGIIYDAGSIQNGFQFRTFNNSTRMVITDTGDVGIGTTTPDAGLEVQRSATVVAAFDRQTNDGTVISIQQAGIEEGTISVSSTTVSYNAFTGSHYGWTEELLERGELVTLTGKNRSSHDNPKSEVIYGVKRSTIANDPACLGSYLGLQESSQPAGPENPHLIMAVGNGDMWVVDEGGNVEIGDYLISSATAGHAMKENGQYAASYVVARAAEPVRWSEVGETVEGKKHRKISVFFESFVKVNMQPFTSELSQLKAENEEVRAELKKLKELVESLAAGKKEEDKKLGQLR